MGWPGAGGNARALAALTTLVALLAAVVLPSTATARAWKPDPAKYGIGKRLNVPVTMSDGTILRADVYFPVDKGSGKPAGGPFPVILTQTPYGKSSGSSAALPGGDQLSGLSGYSPYLVERGYIDVLADVRGTGASQGSWGLFDRVQGEDGAELVRWAAKLPNADGRVGTLGASHLGIIQFLNADNLGRHSPLKAMFPIISANDIYRDTAFMGASSTSSSAASTLASPPA